MNIRAACHVHSDWSYDGSWTLAQLADLFRRYKYQVLMITEHDRGFDEERQLAHRAACQRVSGDGLLVVPGIEYSDPTNTNHILVWGNAPFAGQDRPSLEMLRNVKSHDAVAIFAHPTRKAAWQNFEVEWLEYLDGVEIWNRKTDGFAPSVHGLELANQHGLQPYVGIDFHTIRQFCPMAMRLDIDGEVTEQTVLSAIRNRKVQAEAFYHRGDSIEKPWSRQLFRLLELTRKGGAVTLRAIKKSWKSTATTK